MRKELDRIEIQGEHEARERTWQLVSSAFDHREPTPPRPTRRLVPALAVVFVGAVVAAAVVTTPGRALVQAIRKSIGVHNAKPALFSLPTEGRLLVTSDAGVWIVQPDGSKRLLGRYDEASWSPHGRFVVAARTNELAAIEPNGHVRWTLSRRGVHHPRWGGTATDTRIAYFDKTGLRVVAGDATGDRLVAPYDDSQLAWRPHTGGRVLGYLFGTQLRIKNVETEHVFVTKGRVGDLEDHDLSWSPDGRFALVVDRDQLVLVDVKRDVFRTIPALDNDYIDAAAFSPDGTRLAVDQTGELLVYDLRRLQTPPWRAFAGAGLEGVAWSPDSRWLLVGSPEADQWVFVGTDDGLIRAVSNISAQFRTQEFPRVEGWCCPP